MLAKMADCNADGDGEDVADEGPLSCSTYEVEERSTWAGDRRRVYLKLGTAIRLAA